MCVMMGLNDDFLSIFHQAILSKEADYCSNIECSYEMHSKLKSFEVSSLKSITGLGSITTALCAKSKQLDNSNTKYGHSNFVRFGEAAPRFITVKKNRIFHQYNRNALDFVRYTLLCLVLVKDGSMRAMGHYIDRLTIWNYQILTRRRLKRTWSCMYT